MSSIFNPKQDLQQIRVCKAKAGQLATIGKAENGSKHRVATCLFNQGRLRYRVTIVVGREAEGCDRQTDEAIVGHACSREVVITLITSRISVI